MNQKTCEQCGKTLTQNERGEWLHPAPTSFYDARRTAADHGGDDE